MHQASCSYSCDRTKYSVVNRNCKANRTEPNRTGIITMTKLSRTRTFIVWFNSHLFYVSHQQTVSGVPMYTYVGFFDAFNANKIWNDPFRFLPPPPHHNRFTALFPEPPGWARARRKLLVDIVVLGRITRGRHTDNLGGRLSIRSNQQSTSINPPRLWYSHICAEKGR